MALSCVGLVGVFFDFVPGDLEGQPGLLQLAFSLLLSPNKLLVGLLELVLLDPIDCLLDVHNELLSNPA